MSASARDAVSDWLLDKDINITRGSTNDLADNLIAALSAAGFVIVPREPTGAMGSAFENALFDVVDGYDFTIDKDAAPRLWSAMLSAAEGKK